MYVGISSTSDNAGVERAPDDVTLAEAEDPGVESTSEDAALEEAAAEELLELTPADVAALEAATLMKISICNRSGYK